jgi:hypothetical protein
LSTKYNRKAPIVGGECWPKRGALPRNNESLLLICIWVSGMNAGVYLLYRLMKFHYFRSHAELCKALGEKKANLGDHRVVELIIAGAFAYRVCCISWLDEILGAYFPFDFLLDEVR